MGRAAADGDCFLTDRIMGALGWQLVARQQRGYGFMVGEKPLQIFYRSLLIASSEPSIVAPLLGSTVTVSYLHMNI